MKKIIKILLGTFFVLATIAVFYISIFDVPIISKTSKQVGISEYVYKTSGAFKYNGSYYSKTKLTYRELFFKQEILEDSNIEGIDLDELAPLNEEIFVPFYNSKIHWKNIESEKDFELRGVSKKYAKILFKFKQKNKKENLTWNNFTELSGIGIRTVEKLKTFLVID